MVLTLGLVLRKTIIHGDAARSAAFGGEFNISLSTQQTWRRKYEAKQVA